VLPELMQTGPMKEKKNNNNTVLHARRLQSSGATLSLKTLLNLKPYFKNLTCKVKAKLYSLIRHCFMKTSGRRQIYFHVSSALERGEEQVSVPAALPPGEISPDDPEYETL
jgi:hypothetical protein